MGSYGAKKVWNPLKKAYWTKGNLFPTEAEREKFKSEMKAFGDEIKTIQEDSRNKGRKIRRIGWTLTWMITLPLLLSVFLGIFGMIIGGIIFLIGVARIIKR